MTTEKGEKTGDNDDKTGDEKQDSLLSKLGTDKVESIARQIWLAGIL